jgi:hypothetical protein
MKIDWHRFARYLFGLSFLKAHNLKNAEAQLMQNFLEYQKLLHTPRQPGPPEGGMDSEIQREDALFSGLLSGISLSLLLEINCRVEESIRILQEINEYLDCFSEGGNGDDQKPTVGFFVVVDKLSFLVKLILAKFHKRLGNLDVYMAYLKSYKGTEDISLNNLKHYKLGVQYYKGTEIKKAIYHLEKVRFKGHNSEPVVVKA